MLLATVNEQTMVPFVSQQLNNLDLALSLAKRGNLPGAEALVGQNFERLFANGQYKEAAEAAAESPQVLMLIPLAGLSNDASSAAGRSLGRRPAQTVLKHRLNTRASSCCPCHKLPYHHIQAGA